MFEIIVEALESNLSKLLGVVFGIILANLVVTVAGFSISSVKVKADAIKTVRQADAGKYSDSTKLDGVSFRYLDSSAVEGKRYGKVFVVNSEFKYRDLKGKEYTVNSQASGVNRGEFGEGYSFEERTP